MRQFHIIKWWSGTGSWVSKERSRWTQIHRLSAKNKKLPVWVPKKNIAHSCAKSWLSCAKSWLSCAFLRGAFGLWNLKLCDIFLCEPIGGRKVSSRGERTGLRWVLKFCRRRQQKKTKQLGPWTWSGKVSWKRRGRAAKGSTPEKRQLSLKQKHLGLKNEAACCKKRSAFAEFGWWLFSPNSCHQLTKMLYTSLLQKIARSGNVWVLAQLPLRCLPSKYNMCNS